MRTSRTLLVILLAVFGIGTLLAAEEAPAVPAGAKGFLGQAIGTLVKKNDQTFVLKVEKIGKTWKENKATEPASLVGKEIVVSLNERPRLLELYKALKEGDKILVGLREAEGKFSAVEELRKIEAERKAE